MKIAIEDNKKRIAFFSFDGRHLNKFIEKAKRDIKGLIEIWTYSGTVNGHFKNVKTIYKLTK